MKLIKDFIKQEDWFIEPVELPERSTLFCLLPIGVGTPYVENGTSYITRIANLYCETTSQFIKGWIVPLYGREYLVSPDSSLNTFISRQANMIISTGELAFDWVETVESLTLRTDLAMTTMLFWRNVLSSRSLIRTYKAWCPNCFQDWKKQKISVYEPLLWVIKEFDVCPIHKSFLCFECPNPDCKKQLPVLSPNERVSYCCYCGNWLGNIGQTENDIFQKKLEIALSRSTQIGELLAYANPATDPPNKETIPDSFEYILETLADGTEAKLARFLGVSVDSIKGWVDGRQLITMKTLLDVSQKLGVSALTFLNLKDGDIRRFNIDMDEKAGRKRDKKVIYSFNKEEIKKKLDLEIANSQQPPLSMRQVALAIGHDLPHLINSFPIETRLISNRFRKYKAAKKEERKRMVNQEVRNATYQVHANGTYPSQKHVQKYLSKPCFIREGEQEWKDCLNELGYQTNCTDQYFSVSSISLQEP